MAFSMIPDPNDPEYQRWRRQQEVPGNPYSRSMLGQGNPSAIAQGGTRESPAYGDRGNPRAPVAPPGPGGMAPPGRPPTPGMGPSPMAAPPPMSAPPVPTGAPAGGSGFQRTNPYAMPAGGAGGGMGGGMGPAAAGAAAGGGGALGGAAAPIIGVLMDYMQRQKQANAMRQDARQQLAARYAASTGYPTDQIYAAQAMRDARNASGGEDYMKYLLPFMGGRGMG
jgi:hypothetical protein